jgi:hypothetical protein
MFGHALVLWILTARATSAFKCKSDIELGPVAAARHKGIAIDDTTFWNCSSRIPSTWPNTEDKITSMRLFKAWDDRWGEDKRTPAWDNIVSFLKKNDAKVLIGTQITCNETEDNRVWNWTKEFVKKLDPSHVMGLAIGNEMELLFMKTGVDSTVTGECITKMWSGGDFFRRFSKYVAEFDKMGFQKVPVTSVFGGFTLTPYPGFPFYNDPKAMVSDFFSSCYKAYKDRFVFTFNLYPYFDPNLELDPDGGCKTALSTCDCWTPACNVPMTALACRQKIRELTGGDGVLWLGETGWSSPFATTLNTNMNTCEEWSSTATLKQFYGGFLTWDLSEEEGSPDHVFYFAAHDSVNFGVGEHFGLLGQCQDERCKLHSENIHNGTKAVTTYDCDEGLDDWENEWPHNKKVYCCLHLAGCPTSKPDSSEGSSEANTTTIDDTSIVKVDDFDCETGYYNWKGWPEDKKVWCCNHRGRACESDKPYDCQHWLSIWQEGWTDKKKEWCCENEQLGCAGGDEGGAIRMAEERETRGSSMERLLQEYPIVVSFTAGCFGVFALVAAVFGCARMMTTLRSTYSGLENDDTP